MKIALITGATSGIGKATAEIFADHGINLIICGRRKDRLDELEQQLSSEIKVMKLSFDVRNKEEVFKAIDSLPEKWKNIDILINNAGSAHGLSPIQDGNTDDWDTMLDVNVKGLLYVSKAVMPLMIKNKRGHIINLGSIAGKEVYPNGNVYAASKHAVEAINNAMRIDLNKEGIKVSSINPGAVETEFSIVRFNGDEERAKKMYEGFQPLNARDIAETILFVVTRPAHVNISDMIVFPMAQVNSMIFNRT